MQQLNDLVFAKQQLSRLATGISISDSNVKKDDTFYIGEANGSHIQADRDNEGNFLFQVIASSPRKFSGIKSKAEAFKWEQVYEHEKTQGVFRFALPLTEDEASLLRRTLHLRQRKQGKVGVGAK